MNLLRESLTLAECATLLSEESGKHLEEIVQASATLTRKKFGKTIQLFAPLYISNECINDCTYCGFKRDNLIPRVTLTPERIEQEARFLYEQGHRHLLLVSGEHPGAVSIDFLENIITRLRPLFSSLSIEVQPLKEENYRRLVDKGLDGVVIYQETYNRQVYAETHCSGPKKFFDKRLEAIEAAASAGIRFLGIGALFGLAPWKEEALAIIQHARFLQKKYWRTQLSISFPRITKAAEDFKTPHPVPDREFVQLICVMRLALPDIDLVLSTRESPKLRDRLIHLGITRMSAGSSTEPGGYLTPGIAGEQFHLDDVRSPKEIAAMLSAEGFDPVWKNWEQSL